MILYHGGTIHSGEDFTPVEALVVDGPTIAHLGDLASARAYCDAHGSAHAERDLRGGHVLPGFHDAHTHLLSLGQSMGKADLHPADSASDIVDILRAHRAAHPEAPRLLGQGWLFSQITGARPHRALLDAEFGDLPVYLDAHDLHSTWVNTAALDELGITAETVPPVGGTIEKDEDGRPTGLLLETAASEVAWPFLEQHTPDEDKRAAIRIAVAGYLASGVTSATDMAIVPDDWTQLTAAAAAGELPLKLSAHWLLSPAEDDLTVEVERAAALREAGSGPAPQAPRIIGVKIVSDGVIDACTAAMRSPYSDGTRPDPIWSADKLVAAIAAADAHGLAVAVHAIGDAAVDQALDAFETALAGREPRARHRIEHLEVTDDAQLARLARLGLTASMQPVHADPAIQDAWRDNLGDERISRGYAWKAVEDSGALLAFGTDAPTAPHPPLPNLFVATTRRSAIDPRLEPNHPEQAVDAAAALRHATADAAKAASAPGGVLAVGAPADFVVLDADPFGEAATLLDTTVELTVVDGESVYERNRP